MRTLLKEIARPVFRTASWSVAVAVLLAATVPALGQSDADLAKLYDQLVKPGVFPPAGDVKAAEEKVRAIDASKLSGDAKGHALALQTLVALSHGDAATALGAAMPLLGATKDGAAVELVYCAACAAGDAQLMDKALAAISSSNDEKHKGMVSARKRANQMSGEVAPDVAINLDGGGELSPRKRGSKALVIDFWSMLPAPSEAQVAALKKRYTEAKGFGSVEFIGVNADSETRTAKAREFVKTQGLEWPQKFEGTATKAPITHEAFKCGAPPWTMVIDQYGFIRATGAAGDPGVIYALKAVGAEARGDFERVRPRTHDGKQPEEPKEPEVSVTKSNAAKSGGGDNGLLKSNPDAASKMRQVALYRKTGKNKDARKLLEEVIRDYPGTREAQDAEAELANMPP